MHLKLKIIIAFVPIFSICLVWFGINHYLAFAWLFKCMQMHAVFFQLSCCFYVFAWVCMVFCGRIPVYQPWVCMLVYQMPNVRMSFKWVSFSNLMMFEWFFLILKYLQNCNPISSFTVLHHVPWNTFICSATWCFH